MAARVKREKLRSSCAAYFPLLSVDSVVQLFRSQVSDGATPDLTLLSIVLGAVENLQTAGERSLCQAAGTVDQAAAAAADPDLSPFPEPIEFNEIETLYNKFSAMVKGLADVGHIRASNKRALHSSMELIKNVSNTIWAGLSSSYYKDRAHMQSIYSFLTGNKLDSFGVALAVVAGCQLLGLDDVHLALTEEHAWVVFGDNGSQSIEVTWHGKGVEDKRGQPVTPSISDKSWLYLSGQSVICDTYMEVAAMVTSINPSIAASVDSRELNTLQQRLLWILYDSGRLKKYPMAITNIGDLEEVNPTPGRVSPEFLFKEAIESVNTYYHNMHVYPYTYLAGYYYRNKRYKEALGAWAEASQVISKYNYHRDDEEVYKEFLEIANEIIPNAIRSSTEFVSLGKDGLLSKGRMMSKTVDSMRCPSLLQDPQCCALFFKFYDGICEWEEGSSTPVLHITWATHMLNSLSKFDPDTRARVQLLDCVDETASSAEQFEAESNLKNSEEFGKYGDSIRDRDTLSEKRSQRRPGRPSKRASLKISTEDGLKTNGKGNATDAKGMDSEINVCKLTPWKKLNSKEDGDDEIKSTIKEFISRVSSSHGLEPDPTIVALGHACGESILNPAYLLGKGEPFALKGETGDGIESVVGSTYFPLGEDIPLADTADFKTKNGRSCLTAGGLDLAATGNGIDKVQGPILYLRSTKMKEMKELLTAKKLNANAIKLHLTAQSQVIVKHSRLGSGLGFGSGGKPVKRLRR